MPSTATMRIASPARIGFDATAFQYSLWTYTFPSGAMSVAALPISPTIPTGPVRTRLD